MLDLKPRLGIDRHRAVDVQRDAVADHHVGERLLVGVLGQYVADVFALAQHGHAVGHVQHLVQLVRDDDQRLAILLHRAHDLEQLIGLLRGQHGGRLVKNQDVRTAEEHLDDLHGLLLRDGHIVDLLVWLDVEAVFLADLGDPRAGRLQVELTLTLKAENDVLCGGEHIDQLEVLVDHADAVVKGILGGGDGHRLSMHIDLTLIGVVDAGEHIHQRGFSAAVLTKQGQNLALMQLQIHMIVGCDLAEALGDVFHFHGAGRFHSSHSFLDRKGTVRSALIMGGKGKGPNFTHLFYHHEKKL